MKPFVRWLLWVVSICLYASVVAFADPPAANLTEVRAWWPPLPRFPPGFRVPPRGAPPLHVDLYGSVNSQRVGELALLGAVTMVDEMGQVYTLPGAPTSQRKDRWTAILSIPEAPEGVRKIRSIEGTLYAWQEPRPISVDLDLPVNGEAVREKIDGCEVELQSLTPAMANRGPKAKCRFSLPPGRLAADGFREGDGVSLVGQSGAVYPAGLTWTGQGGEPAGSVLTVDSDFAPIPEPVKAVRVQLLLTSGMMPVARVRLGNIPVDGRTSRTPHLGEAPDLGPPSALADPSGGFLTIPEIRDPTARGALVVGIAPISQGKAGSLHWKEIPLPHKGATRIGPIRPGDYRVVVSARPDGTGQSPGAPKATDLRLSVIAGKETPVPLGASLVGR